MRVIKAKGLFKRDYKNLRHNKDLESALKEILEYLANDQELPPSTQDHALAGEWAGCRECHVKPDILLIYEKERAELLRLVRIGSHSKLFG